MYSIQALWDYEDNEGRVAGGECRFDLFFIQRPNQPYEREVPTNDQ
jgi:hypothetical protein